MQIAALTADKGSSKGRSYSRIPNIEEDPEMLEKLRASIVLEEKEKPSHFSGMSIFWVICTKGGQCPATPSQEWRSLTCVEGFTK